MSKPAFAWNMPVNGGNWRIVDADGRGVHMADFYEMHLIEYVNELESKLEEALERDAKGDTIIHELTLERDQLAGRLDTALAELEEASPMQACSRCDKRMRAHKLIIEEGDRWECPECWEIGNAQDAADAQRLRDVESRQRCDVPGCIGEKGPHHTQHIDRDYRPIVVETSSPK